MIIAIKQGVSNADIQNFTAMLEKQGVAINFSQGASHTVIGLVGDTTGINAEAIAANHIVEKIIRVQEPFKRANRMFHPQDTLIDIPIANGKKQSIGSGYVAIMAGPCSVESPEQIVEVAKAVQKSGAGFLRGGAFKPRTSPYSFQGMGGDGIKLLLEAKKVTGLPIVTELMDIQDLKFFDDVDIIQVGARNMQNFTLLKELGHSRKTVLLKRGYAATLTEMLMSAEYIMAGGNEHVILCERGIRSFDNVTRNVLDLAAIPALKKKSHLPVIVDPSHATGLAWMVATMSKAAIAAGADGLIIEVHNNPECALCDGEQSITPLQFDDLMITLRKYADLEGKKI
ncbi:MAG: 3-deoxy-7-phosphoheptulonate synthase [Termitinemataceae bacterium]|nr:MAG: 3-deoxy-7-phosphoheptulonate synthase [Termitinemataceae bacterium]